MSSEVDDALTQVGGAPSRDPFTNVSKPHLLLGCLLAVHLAMRILPNRTTHPL